MYQEFNHQLCVVSDGFSSDEVVLCHRHANRRRRLGEQVMTQMPAFGTPCHDCERQVLFEEEMDTGFGQESVIQEIEEILDPFDNGF